MTKHRDNGATTSDWPVPIGLEQLRHCDIKECPHCHVLVSVRALELEERERDDDWFADQGKIEAVWCPHCSEPLYDSKGWVEQRAEQKAYDRELQRRNATADRAHADAGGGDDELATGDDDDTPDAGDEGEGDARAARADKSKNATRRRRPARVFDEELQA